MSDPEIVARVERRRQWTAAEKAALMAEVAAENGRVVDVARRHRISPSLLYNWRSALKCAAATTQAATGLTFVPLGVVGDAGTTPPAALSLSTFGPPPAAASGNNKAAGGIEIALPNGTQIRVDALVNEQTLARVLRVLKEVA